MVRNRKTQTLGSQADTHLFHRGKRACLTFACSIAALATPARGYNCLSRLPNEQHALLAIPQLGSTISWEWRLDNDKNTSVLEAPGSELFEPEFSVDDGRSWSADPRTCLGSDTSELSLTDASVTFRRYDASSQYASGEYGKLSPDFTPEIKMTDAVKSRTREQVQWELDPRVLELAHTGRWQVTIADAALGISYLSFDLIVATGCQREGSSNLDADGANAQLSSYHYIWPQPSFEWTKIDKPSKWRSLLPQISDEQCEQITNASNAQLPELIPYSQRDLSKLLRLSLEDAGGGQQSVQIDPIIKHGFHFDHQKFDQSLDMTVLIRFGDYYFRLVQGPLNVVECKDVLQINPRSPPLTLQDESVTSLTGPTTVLHDDSRDAAHYLNNVVFEFEVNSERLDDGNFDKSSIERCMTPEALNALEIHCQAVKVPSSAAASMLIDQDNMAEGSEPVFSVGLDDLAFKMSSCHLATSTEEMMSVKRRRLEVDAITTNPGLPCSIIAISHTWSTGEYTLEYTLPTQVENCQTTIDDIKNVPDGIPAKNTLLFPIEAEGDTGYKIKQGGTHGQTHNVDFVMSKNDMDVAKINYNITRHAEQGVTPDMRLTRSLTTALVLPQGTDVLLNTDPNKAIDDPKYTDGTTPFVMTQSVFQKAQTILLPFTAKQEDDPTSTDADLYLRNQDKLGWLKHEIFWARNDEKVANCAAEEEACYIYLKGARTDPGLQMKSTNTYQASTHQFEIVTDKVELEWRAEIGQIHWVFHTVSHEDPEGDGLSVFWTLRSWPLTITDPCDALDAYEFTTASTFKTVGKSRQQIKRENVDVTLPGFVKSFHTADDINDKYYSENANEYYKVNIMNQLFFRFTNADLYDTSEEFHLFSMNESAMLWKDFLKQETNTYISPCGAWSVIANPPTLTPPNAGITIDQFGYVKVSDSSQIPDTDTPGVEAQVTTVEFTIKFTEHGIATALALYQSEPLSAEIMLGGCALTITPRTSDAAWATSNTIFVKRELSSELFIGDTNEIAFIFGEGGRCGGLVTQAYKLESFTYQGPSDIVSDPDAEPKNLTDFSTDFFIDIVEVPHTTILLPSPTQFMSMKFKSYAALQLSFSITIQASWMIGTYQVPTTGAGTSENPPVVYTPALNYEISSVVDSYHLKLMLTEAANGVPLDDIYRFSVVQKTTLPEDDDNEEQFYYLKPAQFVIRYEFIVETFAFSKADGKGGFVQESPCVEANPQLCTVAGTISGALVSTATPDATVKYSIGDEFPATDVTTFLYCEGDDEPGVQDETEEDNPSTALQTTGWNETDFKISCGNWNLENENTTVPHRIRVYDNFDPGLLTYINVECVYVPCKNWVAFSDTGDIDEYTQPEVLTRMKNYVYQVYKGSRRIQLPSIHLFCDDHNVEQEFEFTQLMYYEKQTDSRYPLTLSKDEVNAYGITWDAETLTINAANETWYNFTFELTVLPRAAEEKEWYNSTYIKIMYVKPPCEVSQTRLNSYAQSNEIVLKAVKGSSIATWNLADTFDLANQAFKTSQRTFCGTMETRYNDGGGEQPFTIVDLKTGLVTLQPEQSHIPGEYSAAHIEFYDLEYDLSMKIYIKSTVTACDVSQAKFANSKVLETYSIGTDAVTVSLPDLKLPAGCDVTIKFIEQTLLPITEPAGYAMNQLLAYDAAKKTFNVKKAVNFNLVDKILEAKLTVKTDFGSEISMNFIVTYSAAGPQFAEDSDSYPVQPITCSQDDNNWTLELPQILGEEDGESETKVKLLQTSAFASQFQYVKSKHTVFIKKDVLKQLSIGYCCPNYETEFPVAIELSSDTLGTTTNMFYFTVEAAPDAVTHDPFEDGAECEGFVKVRQTKVQEDFTFPSWTISKISFAGLVTIKFSDEFVVREDLLILKEVKEINLEGDTRPYFEVVVDPIPDQNPASVAFTWEAVSWSATELVLQINFAAPYEVSADYEKNTLQVKVWNQDLFIRQKDFEPLPKDEHVITKTIPLQISAGAAAALTAVGDSVGNGGQFLTIAILVLNLVASYSMQQILSQVRSLSMITHLQMMQLNVPPSAIIFFSALFEFVTFDIVPTDVIYQTTFAWENIPYSESAENIGYGSRQIIENTGSVPIFMIIIFFQQLLFAIIVRLLKEQGRVLNYAQQRRAGFFYSGFNDFFNETYINLCFSVCINTSYIAFGTNALMFNTLVALITGIAIVAGPLVLARKLSKAWKPLEHIKTPEIEAEEKRLAQLEAAENDEENVGPSQSGQQSNSSSSQEESESRSEQSSQELRSESGQESRSAVSVSESDRDPSEEVSELGSEYYSEAQSDEDNQNNSEQSDQSNERISARQRRAGRRGQLFEGGEAEQSRRVLAQVRPGRALTSLEIEKSRRLVAKKKRRALTKRQEAHDQFISERYGTVTQQLAERDCLAPADAVFFVVCYFFRRLFQAFIILALFKYPVAQILSTLMLNLGYLLVIVHLKPLRERMDQRFTVINEIAIIYTIYMMMLFTADFIPDGETRQTMGLVTIGISAVNFGVNGIPIYFGFKGACREKAIQQKRKAAQQKKEQERLDAFANENKVESVYAKKKRLVDARIQGLHDQLHVIQEEQDSNNESDVEGKRRSPAKKRVKKGKKKVTKKKSAKKSGKKGGKKGAKKGGKKGVEFDNNVIVLKELATRSQQVDHSLIQVGNIPIKARAYQDRVQGDLENLTAHNETHRPGSLPTIDQSEKLIKDWIVTVQQLFKEAAQQTRRELGQNDGKDEARLKELGTQLIFENDFDQLKAQGEKMKGLEQRRQWFQQVLEFAILNDIEPLPPIPREKL